MQRSLPACRHKLNRTTADCLKRDGKRRKQQPVTCRVVGDAAADSSSKRAFAAILAASLALQPTQLGYELILPRNAQAHVAIDKLMQQQQQEALQQMSAAGFNPASSVTARGA